MISADGTAVYPWNHGETLTAAALNAAIAQGGLSGGTLTGPLNYTATGGTTSRAAQDRAADIANVLDYGAGQGGDDAAAIRAAIASGKQVIYIPPGSYTMKSTVASGDPATNPICILLQNKQDVCVYAYGATFTTDNSLNGPSTQPGIVHFDGNSKHCQWLGGTFVGNNTGLSTSQENTAFSCCSVTNITIRDVKITGTFLTALAGVWMFDCTVENIMAYNLANALDLAHTENLTFRRCQFLANPSNAVTGANVHYDVPTLGSNTVTTETGAARSLATGCTNNLRFLECIFDGFSNGIAIDCVSGLLVSRSVLRNGLVASSANAQAGMLIYRSSAAQSAGLPTTNITVEDCDIYGNGLTAGAGAGGGIYIGSGVGGTITNTNILNCRIYDNTASGVTSAAAASIAGLVVMGCDFRTRSGSGVQTSAFVPVLRDLLAAGSAAAGTARNNAGSVTPGSDYLMIEGSSQSGVADADTKMAVLRLTSNFNAAGSGGGIEFGGRRNAGGAGAAASGYFASLKGALVDGSNNTIGTLDVYLRNVGTDTALTKFASFTSTGMNIPQLNVGSANGGGPNIRSGTGAATGTQPAGSLWLRTDGAAGSRIYVSAGGGTWAAIAGV